jgi:hypothetical protein
MKKTYSALLSAILVLAMSATASAQTGSPTISVQTTLAPNAFGSPSWDQWVQNGLYAAENGLSTDGAAGPTQYNTVSGLLPVADNIVTGYTSWMGQADPTGAFANEYGNRASFTTEINGNGSLISISELGFSGSSSDPADGLGVGFSFPSDVADPTDSFWTYDATDIGVIDNSDGTFTYVTSGDPTQLVNEIISIGAGNAYPSYTAAEGGDDPDPTATDQQILDYDLAQIPSSYDFTGTFTYGDTDLGSATFDFGSPASDGSSAAVDALVLGGMVLGGLVLAKRHGQRRAS